MEYVRDGPSPHVKKPPKELQGVAGDVLVVIGCHGLRGGYGSYRVKEKKSTVHDCIKGNNEFFKWMRPLLPEAANLVGVYYCRRGVHPE
eukprot:COSAG02_NODE_76_length_41115_cov_60.967817_27_plen_89_part_00